MHTSNLIELAISLILGIWLALLLFRRNVQRRFPVFFSFTIYATAATAARLLTGFHYRTYFFVFWWTEAFLLLFSLAALHEVFHWMFDGFYRLWWFRLFYYGTIAVVLSISVANAILYPPVQAHPVIGMVLDMSNAVDLVQVGIVGLFYVFRRLLVVEFQRHPYGIIVGFGMSSALPLVGYLARSEFGTKVDFFTRHSSAVAYILGLIIWIASFIRPEPEDKWEPPMSPEQMLQEVQGYLKAMGISKSK